MTGRAAEHRARPAGRTFNLLGWKVSKAKVMATAAGLGLFSCCGGMGALAAFAPPMSTTTTSTAGTAAPEPVDAAPPPTPATTTTVPSRVDAEQVVAAVGARGVAVGRVRDTTTGACAELRCRRLVTTDVLSVYEFDAPPDAERFASTASVVAAVLRKDTVVVRLAIGGTTPRYDGDLVRAALTDLAFAAVAPPVTTTASTAAPTTTRRPAPVPTATPTSPPPPTTRSRGRE